MILKSVNIIGEEYKLKQDISIKNDIITDIKTTSDKAIKNDISFKQDVIAFPGLINAHDHLALNTHNLHKTRIYNDYIDWASDNFEKKIKEINSIPFHLRYQWGVVKNVLHGFTTVIQHDKSIPNFDCDLADIEIDIKVIHSLHFDSKWRLKSLLPSKKKKMIHLGEGTSSRVALEIKNYLSWNLQPQKTIAIHGITMKAKELQKMGGLVWCPNSNLHLYNRTADINELKSVGHILFGTDSTVSSDWNIFGHLRQARNMNFLTDEELFNSFTETPSQLFNWTRKGKLKDGKLADIIIAKRKKVNVWDSFYELNSSDILLIVKSGKIVFFDESILTEVVYQIQLEKFEKMKLHENYKYLKFPLKTFSENIKKYYPRFEFPSGLSIH